MKALKLTAFAATMIGSSFLLNLAGRGRALLLAHGDRRVTYKGKCIGGPLDGREFEHSYYQFQYPVRTEAASVFDPIGSARASDLVTMTHGVYTWVLDKGVWKWSW